MLSNQLLAKLIVFKSVIKSESFPVGLALTFSAHSRSILSKAIFEHRTSKLFARRSGHLLKL